MKKYIFYSILIWLFSTEMLIAQAIVEIPSLGCGRLLNVNKFNNSNGGITCIFRLGRVAENAYRMTDPNINSFGRIYLGTGAAIGCRMYLTAYRDDGVKFPANKPIYIDIEAQGFNFNASINNANVVFYNGNNPISRQSIGGKFFIDFGGNAARKLVKFIPPAQWDRIEIETTELAGIGFAFSEIKVYNIFSEFYRLQNLTFSTQPSDKTILEGGDTNMQANIAITDETPNNITYQWQVNMGNGWNDLSNNATYNGVTTTNLQINNVPRNFDNFKYRLLAHSQFGSCLFNGASDQATLRVNYVSGGQVVSDQKLCRGKEDNPVAFTQTITSVGSGVLTYQWEYSFNNLSFINISGAVGTTYDPPAGVNQTTYYRRKTTSELNGTTISSHSNILKVSVIDCYLNCIISNKMITIGLKY